ncbi:MAG: glutamine--fructose-6-phosphate transaminase (isomerizing) [Alphaproteobacteria bacterium]|nr:glutamine--fructose-6-phosphate transaminase (isomerizing) [Alphaproteobacteria bacterium]
MCGIFGIIGKTAVSTLILRSLKNLEYRGYDSAGLAVLHEGQIERCRAVGKLYNLESMLNQRTLSGRIGIGHTRWATHGAATESNAHPHITDRLAIVHNGTIQNFRSLKKRINEKGIECSSETDSEVIAQLLTLELNRGKTPAMAMQQVLQQLEGAFAFVVLFRDHENLLAAARRGAALVIGLGDGEMFVGSDAMALAPFTSRAIYLEDDDWALFTADNLDIFDKNNAPIQRSEHQLPRLAMTVRKGDYRHFMLKEIHEQPESIGRTLAHYVNFADDTIRLPVGQEDGKIFDVSNSHRLLLSGCGTAYYAGLIAKYWFERLAKLPVDIDVGSEFHYRDIPFEKDGVALFISQSGETADTLISLKDCKKGKQNVGSIVNVLLSSMARETDILFPTLAGIEIGVASTKAFTCQLAVLAILAIFSGRQRHVLDASTTQRLVQPLGKLPHLCATVLKLESQIEELARWLSKAQNVLYLGRGVNYPLAMEGALKLKELSYIHAEGYAAGELKHGPIALIDENMPVIFLAPYDHLFQKTLSNIEEVSARGGQIVVITDEKGASSGLPTGRTIIMPDMPEMIMPIVYALPMQLLAYHVAVHRGTDVDQPRNLAKSVTVE